MLRVRNVRGAVYCLHVKRRNRVFCLAVGRVVFGAESSSSWSEAKPFSKESTMVEAVFGTLWIANAHDGKGKSSHPLSFQFVGTLTSRPVTSHVLHCIFFACNDQALFTFSCDAVLGSVCASDNMDSSPN